MKLYQYYFRNDNDKLEINAIDVKETKQNYIDIYGGRTSKSEIEKVLSYIKTNGDIIYLLEDDTNKAIDIFTNYIQDKINCLQKQIYDANSYRKEV